MAINTAVMTANSYTTRWDSPFGERETSHFPDPIADLRAVVEQMPGSNSVRCHAAAGAGPSGQRADLTSMLAAIRK
jgi:hypothetical protein